MVKWRNYRQTYYDTVKKGDWFVKADNEEFYIVYSPDEMAETFDSVPKFKYPFLIRA